jgi:hexosaminidase
MSSFIFSTSSKRIRIWGTNEPSNSSSVSKNITIQHWEWFEDDPVALLEAGYEVINSDDAFYIVSKFSASYPQQLNLTRIFHGDPTKPGGGAFAPYIFDVNRPTHNPEKSNPAIPGHIAAQWNDYGNNASTVLEAYYAWREGLAALGDKQWGGQLTEDEYPALFAKLQPKVPGQNLDRAVPSQSDLIFSYDFAQVDGGKVRDGSGNGYDASLEGGATLENGTLLLESPGGQASLTTPLQSKGRPYTLSFSVFPSASSRPGGTIFSSSDASLLLGNGTLGNVIFLENGNAYVLNYTLPAEVWTSVELVGRDGGVTALRVSSDSNSTGSTGGGGNGGIEEEREEMPFLARLGINGESFEWRNISIVAPLARIGGSGFVGRVRGVKLRGSA